MKPQKISVSPIKGQSPFEDADRLEVTPIKSANALISYWKPTPQELASLNAGHVVAVVQALNNRYVNQVVVSYTDAPQPTFQ